MKGILKRLKNTAVLEQGKNYWMDFDRNLQFTEVKKKTLAGWAPKNIALDWLCFCIFNWSRCFEHNDFYVLFVVSNNKEGIEVLVLKLFSVKIAADLIYTQWNGRRCSPNAHPQKIAIAKIPLNLRSYIFLRYNSWIQYKRAIKNRFYIYVASNG